MMRLERLTEGIGYQLPDLWPEIRRILYTILFAATLGLILCAWDAWHSNTLGRILAMESRVAYLEGAARPLVQGADGTTVNFFLDGEKEGENE